MGVELQVLYGKLFEMKIVLQDLQGKVMAEKSRVDVVEAGLAALANKNSNLNDELARLQVHMNELQKTLDEVEREKISAADLVTSTTKNINSLTEQLVNERQILYKQVCFLTSKVVSYSIVASLNKLLIFRFSLQFYFILCRCKWRD